MKTYLNPAYRIARRSSYLPEAPAANGKVRLTRAGCRVENSVVWQTRMAGRDERVSVMADEMPDL